ncbi:MAG: hypothetical protein M0R51_08625 [Clostridia bacterium]|jgi:hypothetical protein|nr:hypothetical protein [Clostridia bacterium]
MENKKKLTKYSAEKVPHYTKSVSYIMFGKRNRELNADEKRKLNAFLKAQERKKYPERYKRDIEYSKEYNKKLKSTEQGKLKLMEIHRNCYQRKKNKKKDEE